jgi:hypothetical protein
MTSRDRSGDDLGLGVDQARAIPPGPPRSRWPVVAVAVTVVVLVGGLVYWWGTTAEDEPSPPATAVIYDWGFAACLDLPLGSDPQAEVERGRQQVVEVQGSPADGEQVVAIAEHESPPAWSFRIEEVEVTTRLREGVVARTSLDSRTFSWTSEASSPSQWRTVIHDGTAWTTRGPDRSFGGRDWHSCPAPGPINANLRLLQSPIYDGRSNGAGPPWCGFIFCSAYVAPGMSLRTLGATPEIIDGEPMKTYELTGRWVDSKPRDADPLRATFSLDGQQRLRRAKAWSTVTGQIHSRLRIDPLTVEPVIGPPTSDDPFDGVPVPERPVPTFIDDETTTG